MNMFGRKKKDKSTKKETEENNKITAKELEKITDFMKLEAPKITQIKTNNEKFLESGELDTLKDFSDQLKVTDFSKWSMDFQDKTLKEFSEQLIADGISYSLYEAYKDNFSKLKRETDLLNEKIDSGLMNKIILEREREQSEYKITSDYLVRFDKLLKSSSLEYNLAELHISKERFDEEIKSHPDILTTLVDDKADDAERSTLARINNGVEPTRLAMQEYQKIYKINTNALNSVIALAFNRAREISDEDTPDEYKTLLSIEDKIENDRNETLTLVGISKARTYLTTYIFRTIGKDIQTLIKDKTEKTKEVNGIKTELAGLEEQKKTILANIKELKEQRDTELEIYKEFGKNMRATGGEQVVLKATEKNNDESSKGNLQESTNKDTNKDVNEQKHEETLMDTKYKKLNEKEIKYIEKMEKKGWKYYSETNSLIKIALMKDKKNRQLHSQLNIRGKAGFMPNIPHDKFMKIEARDKMSKYAK